MPAAVSTLDFAPIAGEPAWLRDLRERSVAAARELPLPDGADEVWRYSRLTDFDLTAVHDPDAESALEVPQSAVSARVWAGSLLDHPHPEDVLADVQHDPVDVFSALAAAHARSFVVIDVPAGVRVEEPIVVRPAVPTVGGLAFSRLMIRVGDGAEVAVLEDLSSSVDGGFVVCRTDTTVGSRASIAHGVVQTLGSDAVLVANHSVRVGSGGSAALGVAALGGRTARVRTDCRLEGRGASADLSALYSGRDEQMHDIRTFQRHEGRDTRSDLLFKGVLSGRARSVYTGLIRIEPDARGSEAFQTNRNLKLSDDAWAESVPNLEIECRDVRCSHASTVSPLDEDQMFYLASRGVPPDVAGRLIVDGFFREVVDRFPIRSERARIVALVAARAAEG